MEHPVPSRVSYSQSYAWLQGLLKALRVPIVFLLSGLTSFCAFKDGAAVIGTGPGADRPRAERLVLWDADLMPLGKRMTVREKMSAAFGEQVNPDVLVLYDVPTFAQLLELRDAWGLYGYTAVMSNFFCGRAPRGMAWPLEIAHPVALSDRRRDAVRCARAGRAAMQYPGAPAHRSRGRHA